MITVCRLLNEYHSYPQLFLALEKMWYLVFLIYKSRPAELESFDHDAAPPAPPAGAVSATPTATAARPRLGLLYYDRFGLPRTRVHQPQ